MRVAAVVSSLLLVAGTSLLAWSDIQAHLGYDRLKVQACIFMLGYRPTATDPWSQIVAGRYLYQVGCSTGQSPYLPATRPQLGREGNDG